MDDIEDFGTNPERRKLKAIHAKILWLEAKLLGPDREDPSRIYGESHKAGYRLEEHAALTWAMEQILDVGPPVREEDLR